MRLFFCQKLNQDQFLSNESKMAVRFKMADQRFFDITLRVSNKFPIFLLHSFGVGKTQILWKKKFVKKLKMAGGLKKSFEPPFWIF
jgi:hypothetical protein